MPENLHPYVNVENCERLAAYLESLPEGYSNFDMSDFILNTGNLEDQIDYAKNNGGVHKCGTAACAVGHGPAAGILFPEDKKYWVPHTGAPAWFTYSQLFINNSHGARSIALWSWCFGGDWSLCDDTPHGAAKRLRYLIANLHKREPIPLYDGRQFDSFSLHCENTAEFYMELYS